MSTVQNRFEGTFSDDSQQNSIPIRLLSLCSMLIDGFNPKDTGFSQPALTVSQLIMHEYKKKINRNPSTIRRRHSKIRETPLPIYAGLKLYATVRSKTLIDRLFHLGICVSYERCLEICNDMAISLLEKYNQNKVFIASPLKLKLFTIKDNIGLNASSTKIKQHFHGISMTTMQHFHGISMTTMQHFHGISMTTMQHFHGISMTTMQHFHGISMTTMQFPTVTNHGITQEISYNFDAFSNTQRLNLPQDYICLNDIPFDCSSSLYAPVCIINIEYITTSSNDNLSRDNEFAWLESVSQANRHNCLPWSKFHSVNSEFKQSKPIDIPYSTLLTQHENNAALF